MNILNKTIVENRSTITVIDEPITSLFIHKIFDLIRYYFLFAVIPIGLFGNFISLFIFTRPNLNKKTNTGFLYSILCVLNILTIAEFAFTEKSIDFLHYRVTLHCFLNIFIKKSLFCFLSWMQVLICFDRFLLVIFAVKSKIMAKKVDFGIL